MSSCSTPSPPDDVLSLDELLGFGQEGDDRADFLRAVRTEQEHLLAECMALEGFDYYPFVDIPTQTDRFLFDPATSDLSESEFIALHGYGLTEEFLASVISADLPRDPNLEYVSQLTAAERNAYYVALYGHEDPTQADPAGCLGQAIEASPLKWRADIFLELDHEWAEVLEMTMSDPRLVAFIDEWRACVVTAGYSFGSPDDIHAEVIDRLEGVAGDPLAIEEARVLEIQLATVDYECGGGSRASNLYDEVAAEYERQFIIENWDHLSPLLDEDGS